MVNRWGNNGNTDRLYFLRLQSHCGQWLQPWNKKMLAPWKKSYEPRQCIKKQRYHFANTGLSSQSHVFSSSHVWMWELDYEESWALKNWWFWTVVLEKTLESPLDCKEIQPVHPKGNQPWIFIGRTDAEVLIVWSTDAKSWLIRKDLDDEKDWRQEEKGTTEDEMVGWHHWLDGHEFEWTPGVGDGQGSLVCCSPWGHKQSDTAEWLNNNRSPEADRRAERLWLKSFSEMTGFYTCLSVNYHVIIPSCLSVSSPVGQMYWG